MIQFDSQDLARMEQRYRTHFINSLSGFKTPFLLGSISSAGQTNLAPFSSVVHLGADPALLGIVFRPHTVPRHSLENILDSGCFTLNLPHGELMSQAHQSSARYPREESEFAATGLTEDYSPALAAPYVRECPLGIGLLLRQQVPLEINRTSLVIGEIGEIRLAQNAVAEDGFIDLEQLDILAVSGLDSYHRTRRIARLPYAKPEQK